MELSLRVGKTLFRNISADIFIPSDIKKKERHLIALRLVLIDFFNNNNLLLHRTTEPIPGRIFYSLTNS